MAPRAKPRIRRVREVQHGVTGNMKLGLSVSTPTHSAALRFVTLALLPAPVVEARRSLGAAPQEQARGRESCVYCRCSTMH